ncbi:MAG: tetratricopeptide repeat protein, partial [Gemmataceae bacterium]|nr:tetratricopeptide repeat protein [Gemmataceae bacterium]
MEPWLYVLFAALGLAGLVVLWQVFGLGPRRRRALKRARQRLAEGAWQDALARIRKLRARGVSSAWWKRRLDEAEAQCHETAADLALAGKQYEEALEHRLQAADASGRPAVEARQSVQSAMLEEIRRLFATTSDNRLIHDLIGRTVLVQSPCREASFWQGLCLLRGGESDKALEALQTARTGTGKSIVLDDVLDDVAAPPNVPPPVSALIDPPLYLGAILLRQGKAKDSLRFLTEANRLDSSCPIVTVQLGSAIIAAGGDVQLAVRALQRALGHKGLPQWEGNPRRLWVEALPEGRSYVRKLADKHPFVCPLWGGDARVLLNQGQLALAQGLYKLGNFKEAADLYTKVSQQGAPSPAVVRGLGLALARIGNYDEAFKHLRIAHEMEEPKDRHTAGYLALCGAKGKPKSDEDKAQNVAWAIRIVTSFTAPGDEEWIALVSALFAEARAANVAVHLDDQLYVCEHLVSIHAADPVAAQAYHQLQSTNPEAVRSEYAWLYCRAAQQYEVEGEHALALFARTFAEEQTAREFYAQRGWDFDGIEFTYLERAADLDPGHFPVPLGPDYPPRGEKLLLAHAREREHAGDIEGALTTLHILHRLAPNHPGALDRLAYLHHRRGENEQAEHFLETWVNHHPADPRPLVRFAVLLHQRGKFAECQTQLWQALEQSTGAVRAKIAFWGARLTLQQPAVSASGPPNGALLGSARHFLE